MDASAVVQGQVEAYNARDLERYLAFFDEAIRLYRMPATEPATSGKAQLAQVYGARFSTPDLHADILSRTVWFFYPES